jgi:hypothetical protein
MARFVEFLRSDSGQPDVSFGHRADGRRGSCGIPVQGELSLAPLITFWTQTSAYHEFGRGPIRASSAKRRERRPSWPG